MEIKTTQFGGKYYDELPENTRIASLDDFYNHHGRLDIGKPFIVKSMITKNRFWANRIKPGFACQEENFMQFLNEGFVFVFR